MSTGICNPFSAKAETRVGTAVTTTNKTQAGIIPQHSLKKACAGFLAEFMFWFPYLIKFCFICLQLKLKGVKGYINVLVLLLLGSTITFAQNECVYFEFGFGTNNESYTKAMAVDSLGNSYVTGLLNTTNMFGNIQLTAATRDVFVAKVDAAGQCTWAVRAGTNSLYLEIGEDIVVDDLGNIYITGTYVDSCYFGNIQLNATGASGFTAKISPTGQWLWATNSGGIAIANDKQGSICVANLDLVSVSRLDTNGQVVSTANVVFDFPDGEITDLDVDNIGNVYVVGRFKGSMTLGSIILNGANTTQYDFFVAKLNGNNTWQWATKVGNTYFDTALGVKTDGEGNSYVTGEINNSSGFGSITTTANGDAYVAKIDSSGVWQWVTHSSAITGYARGHDVNIGYDGSVVATGFFKGVCVFGGNTLDGGSNGNMFVLKLTSSGQWVFAESAGGETGFDLGIGVGTDKDGNVFCGGYYQDTIVFGPDTLVALGPNRRGIFVTKVVNDSLSLDSMPSLTITCGDSVQLNSNATDYASIAWQPATTLSNAFIPNPIATPIQTTTYSVSATDYCGNNVMETVTVNIDTVLTVDFDFATSGGLSGDFSIIGSGYDTVSWHFGDGDSSVDVNPTHVYAEVGNYTVTLTVGNVCGQTATVVKTISVEFGTRINNVKDTEPRWSIYPNPMEKEFYIASDAAIEEVSLYDLTGRLVKLLAIQKTSKGYRVMIGETAPGTYLLRINSDLGSAMERVVVY